MALLDIVSFGPVPGGYRPRRWDCALMRVRLTGVEKKKTSSWLKEGDNRF